MRPVANLVAATLEPAGERDLDLGGDRVAGEHLGCFARTAEDDSAARDVALERRVGDDNHAVLVRDRELLLRDLLHRLAQHFRVIEAHVGQ